MIWRVAASGPVQHVTPDGVMDLMWLQGRFVVAGADTRTMVAETTPGDLTWGLQLRPGVAPALLGISADELTDQRVDLADLVTCADSAAFAGDVDVPDALERLYVALWRRADPDRAGLRLAASLDRAARAGRSVRETAALHGLSERSLRRLSDRLFGYGPKTLMRIHRFQQALRLAAPGRTLGDVAAAAGYADQAHFNRETRRLAGRSPTQLLELVGVADSSKTAVGPG